MDLPYPEALADLRHDLGLSVEQFAHLIGVSNGDIIRRWERGAKPIPSIAMRMIDLLIHVPEARDRLLTVGPYLPLGTTANAR